MTATCSDHQDLLLTLWQSSDWAPQDVTTVEAVDLSSESDFCRDIAPTSVQ